MFREVALCELRGRGKSSVRCVTRFLGDCSFTSVTRLSGNLIPAPLRDITA